MREGRLVALSVLGIRSLALPLLLLSRPWGPAGLCAWALRGTGFHDFLSHSEFSGRL